MDKQTKKIDHRRPVVDLVEQARQLRIQAEELERQATMAKGTQRDVKVEVPLIGDELPTPALMELVRTLVAERPMTFQDLLEATGARDNRIKGVLMRLQREGATLVNLGTQARALWFLPNAEVLKRLRAKRG